MSAVQMLTVAEEEGEQRLDRWFKRRFPHVTQGAVEKMCRTGQVRVDGGRVKASDRVAPGMEIRVPPLPVGEAPKHVESRMAKNDAEMIQDAVLWKDEHMIVLNKPAAVMTTRKDPEKRTTVFDLVDDVPGLVYVGRLDFMTEGVLLLTTDGRAAHALTHPSNEVERTYVATVRGDAVTAAKVARRGVQLEDGLVIPREVVAHPLGGRRWALEITIAEGKTHEVRRLCDALELEVERLVRELRDA